MKFGKTLKKYSRPGWRYLNYKFLKQVIRLIHPESNWADDHFRKTLLEEVHAVNKFFIEREAKLMQITALYRQNKRDDPEAIQDLCKRTEALREYMIINYIAVLKILKKHDKVSKTSFSKEILGVFLKQPIYKALKTSMLFTQTERFLKSCTTHKASEEQCPICIDSCVTPVRLPCGHEFCWECLARAVLSDITTCPLCRSEQSLNPVDLNISAILGAVDAHKYFPSNVDPVEIRKRDLQEQSRKQNKQEKLKRLKHTHGLSQGDPENPCCSAVDLTSWVMDKKLLEALPAGCNLKPNPNPTSSSVFDLCGEVHFEINGTDSPNLLAFVIETTPEATPETQETPNTMAKPLQKGSSTDSDTSQTYFPLVPSFLRKAFSNSPTSEVRGMKPQAFRLGLSPESPRTIAGPEGNNFDDWIKDVMEGGSQMQNTNLMHTVCG
mmetsp:Transcript_24060/g.44971  ORF Transcript_24060/g.44971 Transcript_24060/m.44971 type:complete len:438 (-) Transcript_24060:290-1603(-)